MSSKIAFLKIPNIDQIADFTQIASLQMPGIVGNSPTTKKRESTDIHETNRCIFSHCAQQHQLEKSAIGRPPTGLLLCCMFRRIFHVDQKLPAFSCRFSCNSHTLFSSYKVFRSPRVLLLCTCIQITFASILLLFPRGLLLCTSTSYLKLYVSILSPSSYVCLNACVFGSRAVQHKHKPTR
jgi:hypothetical protein